MNLPESILQDLKYGVRALRRNIAFTSVAIFALAIGIGVNTTAFTAYKAMVARPLHARDPGRMVNLALVRSSGSTDAFFSYPDYVEYRDRLHSFSGVIAHSPARLALSGAGGIVSERSSIAASLFGRLKILPAGATSTEFASTFIVSENYFSVLGVSAIQARTFESIPDLPASPSVLISESYWQTRFSGDPEILGRTIYLNGSAFTIAGITPRDFVGTSIFVPAFWLPLSLEPLVHPENDWRRNRENQCCRLFARLAPGAGIAQAQQELTMVANQIRTLHNSRSDAARSVTALVWPGSPFPRKLDGGLKLTVVLVLGAAAMVLVIACVNVAGLQLARATSRQSELGMRLSLGASRPRLIRQLLTESSLLGVLAGGLALPFTWALTRTLATKFNEAFPADLGTLIFRVTPDLEIFLFVFAVSLAAGILFGLTPAIESSRSALAGALKANAGTSPFRSRRIRNVLIAVQVAICLVLMISGSMFIRSAVNLLKTHAGYETKHVIALDFRFPEWIRNTSEGKNIAIRELRGRLAALPGVLAITSGRTPDDGRLRTTITPLNAESAPAQHEQTIRHASVQANYFEVVGIPLLLGRTFQSHGGQAEHVVVISESAAKQLWPGQNPIDRSVRLGDGAGHRVIGVARDTRGFELDGSDSRQVYLPLPDSRLHEYPILIRLQSDPLQLMNALASTVTTSDPNLIVSVSTLEEMLRRTPSFIVSSFAAAFASGVALLGLVLATMGLYSTVSYMVVLRTREVGIRIAIGAQRRDILELILRGSMRPVLAGLLLGVSLAAGVSRLLRGLLFGVQSIDGISTIPVLLLFLTIALLAAYVPSRQAMGVDPINALRYE